MQNYLYIALLFISATAFSQETKAVEDQIFYEVEVKPTFPGGMPALFMYFSKNYKVPRGFEGAGQILAQFVVEKDGSITGIKIVNDMGYGTGAEFARILKKMPNWNPGMQNGNPVRVMTTLPFKFAVPN